MACPAFTEKIHSQPETVTSFGQWVNRKISCSSLTTRNCYLLWPVCQPENQLLFTPGTSLQARSLLLHVFFFFFLSLSAVNFLSESTGACTRLLYRGRQPVMQSQPQTD